MNEELKSKIRYVKGLTVMSQVITPPSFWRHPILWIQRKIRDYRTQQYIKELKLEITFEKNGIATAKRVPNNWYKWN